MVLRRIYRRKAPLGWRAWHAHPKTDAHYTNGRTEQMRRQKKAVALPPMIWYKWVVR